MYEAIAIFVKSILNWTLLPAQHMIVGFLVIATLLLILVVFAFVITYIKLRDKRQKEMEENEQQNLVVLREVLTAISVVRVVMENNFNKMNEVILQMKELLEQENECYAKLSVIDYIIRNKGEESNGKSNQGKGYETSLLGGNPKESGTNEAIPPKNN